MGHYFDVHGYPGTTSALDLSTGLSSVGDALTDVLNRRQKAQQFRDELQFQKEDAQRKFAQNQANDAYQNRIIAERERRDQRQEADRENDRRTAAVNSAMANIKSGHPEMARAGIEGTRIYDPATQSYVAGSVEQGPAADVGPEPQAPVAPVAPAGLPPEIAARRRGRTATSEPEDAGFYKSEGRPMPAAFGVDPSEPPIFTDDGKPPKPEFMAQGLSPEVQGARYQDTADMIAEEQARLDQQKFQGEKSAFDAASAAYPGERAKYEASLAAAEANRPYTIRFGAQDPGVTVHPDELRTEGRKQAADDFISSLQGVTLSDYDKRNAAAARARILAGEDPKKVIPEFERARVTGEGQEFKHGEGLLRDAAAMERAKVNASSPKDQFYRERALEGYAAGNRQDRGELRQELKDWETNTADIRKDAGVWKRLRMSLSNIKADNPVAQQDALLGLASVFRGGNAATKDVTNAVRSHLGGAEASAEGWMEQAATGKLGPEQQRTALAAVQNAVREHDEQVREHYRSFVKRFGPGHGLEDQATTINGFMDSILEEHGLTAPPVYQDADPASGAMGSTRRPYQKPKTPPRRGAPPEIDARRKGKQAQADEAMQ